ncbi:MAG: 30S ribosomal protein S27 [bacterium]
MIHFLSFLLGTLSSLGRRCPACKRVQIFPLSKKKQSVRCKFCGREIPPRLTPR